MASVINSYFRSVIGDDSFSPTFTNINISGDLSVGGTTSLTGNVISPLNVASYQTITSTTSPQLTIKYDNTKYTTYATSSNGDTEINNNDSAKLIKLGNSNGANVIIGVSTGNVSPNSALTVCTGSNNTLSLLSQSNNFRTDLYQSDTELTMTVGGGLMNLNSNLYHNTSSTSAYRLINPNTNNYFSYNMNNGVSMSWNIFDSNNNINDSALHQFNNKIFINTNSTPQISIGNSNLDAYTFNLSNTTCIQECNLPLIYKGGIDTVTLDRRLIFNPFNDVTTIFGITSPILANSAVPGATMQLHSNSIGMGLLFYNTNNSTPTSPIDYSNFGFTMVPAAGLLFGMMQLTTATINNPYILSYYSINTGEESLEFNINSRQDYTQDILGNNGNNSRISSMKNGTMKIQADVNNYSSGNQLILLNSNVQVPHNLNLSNLSSTHTFNGTTINSQCSNFNLTSQLLVTRNNQQLKLKDGANNLITTLSTESSTFYITSESPSVTIQNNTNVIGRIIASTNSSNQLSLEYDGSNSCIFDVDNGGDLRITPSGNNTYFNKVPLTLQNMAVISISETGFSNVGIQIENRDAPIGKRCNWLYTDSTFGALFISNETNNNMAIFNYDANQTTYRISTPASKFLDFNVNNTTSDCLVQTNDGDLFLLDPNSTSNTGRVGVCIPSLTGNHTFHVSSNGNVNADNVMKLYRAGNNPSTIDINSSNDLVITSTSGQLKLSTSAYVSPDTFQNSWSVPSSTYYWSPRVMADQSILIQFYLFNNVFTISANTFQSVMINLNALILPNTQSRFCSCSLIDTGLLYPCMMEITPAGVVQIKTNVTIAISTDVQLTGFIHYYL
jgi:hypothetical protein